MGGEDPSRHALDCRGMLIEARKIKISQKFRSFESSVRAASLSLSTTSYGLDTGSS